ncbi:MAG: molybdopterin converting factor subunit 1 [Gammaproteobacteria bacterium]|nr:molybdopterin converting factor subunit 1 [Gammaproteobacteria bacterium]MYF38704.1 molybdopterin converting factor subunit 1 [Gammaproteobacteria bacterium]
MRSQSITIQVKFFASLKESLGVSQTNLTVPVESTVDMLLRKIQDTYGKDSQLIDISSLRVAVNQQMVEFDRVIREDDEIAIFPPITGG